jgi:RES domain-containing protein
MTVIKISLQTIMMTTKIMTNHLMMMKKIIGQCRNQEAEEIIEDAGHLTTSDRQEVLLQDTDHHDSVDGVMVQGDRHSEVHHLLTLEGLVVPDFVDHHHLIPTGDQCHLQGCIRTHT